MFHALFESVACNVDLLSDAGSEETCCMYPKNAFVTSRVLADLLSAWTREHVKRGIRRVLVTLGGKNHAASMHRR